MARPDPECLPEIGKRATYYSLRFQRFVFQIHPPGLAPEPHPGPGQSARPGGRRARVRPRHFLAGAGHRGGPQGFVRGPVRVPVRGRGGGTGGARQGERSEHEQEGVAEDQNNASRYPRRVRLRERRKRSNVDVRGDVVRRSLPSVGWYGLEFTEHVYYSDSQRRADASQGTIWFLKGALRPTDNVWVQIFERNFLLFRLVNIFKNEVNFLNHRIYTSSHGDNRDIRGDKVGQGEKGWEPLSRTPTARLCR